MRACMHCGLSIGDTATFCTVCGTPAGSGHPGPIAKPLPAQPVLCALCGHPGPLADVESFRLCQRCRGELELLTEREPRAGMSIRPITTEEDERRSTARTVDAVYSALMDGATCKACEEMEGKTTTDLNEAESWTPNRKCTDPDGCRCLVAFQMTSLAAGEVRAFLEHAVQSGLRVNAQSVDRFHTECERADVALSEGMHKALEPMHKAYPLEKTDAAQAIALYRESIVRLLDVTAAPLDRKDVRRELLFIFDRLSLALKRSEAPAEALEEVDAAASLGLLHCQDAGVKGHREALRKRRDSLRRTVGKAAHDTT